jgi:hypothetical protein
MCSGGKKGPFKFDAFVNWKIQTTFSNAQVAVNQSADSPGLTLRGHENLHVKDYTEAFLGHDINYAIPTEGFSTRDECNKARDSFVKNVTDFGTNITRTGCMTRDAHVCR